MWRAHDLVELAELSRTPSSELTFSVFGSQPYLLLHGTSQPPDLPIDSLLRWLTALPCPTIAVANLPNEIVGACDVCVDEVHEALPLITRILQNPIAASVCMQLLRVTENLPIEQALIAESLAYSTLQSGPEFRRWLATHRAAQPQVATDIGLAVLIERTDDTLGLTLNRASNRNAMNLEMRDALIEALQLVLTDSSIQRVTLKAMGRCFSTGGDLTEFGSLPDPATAHLVRSLALPGRLLAACAERVQVHLHGAAVGSGIEFPAFSQHLVAENSAWFQLPELQFGLIPGAGGTVSIPRRIGRQRTAWMILSGARVSAAEALAWGLIDAIQPDTLRATKRSVPVA